MLVKLSKLTSALRKTPLPALAAEAAWRALRSVRKARFRAGAHATGCPVRFRPIGYYQCHLPLISATAQRHLVAYAEAIMAGDFPLLGYGRPHLGERPDWHADWVSGKSWPLVPSHKLKIVRHDGSDVKAPWELSRLQWAPAVAKAWVLTRDQRYRQRLQELLAGWIADNPVGMGVNWTIAMEVALRGISLCLTLELLWPFSEPEQTWLALLENSLWQHLCFIEAHNEFSWLIRSNHYLSNLVGLTTLSACLQGPGMSQRCGRYAQATEREVALQTYADGGDRESSTGYHVLVAQMALHALIVQRRVGLAPAPTFEKNLRDMFTWMDTLAAEDWTLPLLGDCDNGRAELLLDDLAQADVRPGEQHALRLEGLAGLASHVLKTPFGGDLQEAVWFGSIAASAPARRSREPLSILRESGIAVLHTGSASVIFCNMPNGLDGSGSHTHCDKLSFILRLQGSLFDVFCDTGSRTYTRSATQRNIDRSTQAHSTLAVDQKEQNTFSLSPEGLFQSGNEATVCPICRVDSKWPAAQATHHGYNRFGVGHRRTVELHDSSLHLTDEVTAPASMQVHQIDLHFTLGPDWTVSSEMMTGDMVSCVIIGERRLTLTCTAKTALAVTISPSVITRAYGTALQGTLIRIRTSTSLPARLHTMVVWD